jgi:hypothetical protein
MSPGDVDCALDMTQTPRAEPQADRKQTAKTPRGKPFTGKDDPRARQNTNAVRRSEPSKEGLERQSLYEAMLHALNLPARDDRTPGQRACRKWLKRDAAGFLRRLCTLESKQSRPRETESPAPAFDCKEFGEHGRNAVTLELDPEDRVSQIHLELDDQRWEPGYEEEKLSSLFIWCKRQDGSDDVTEVLFPNEQMELFQAWADEDGIPLGEWMKESILEGMETERRDSPI